MKIEKVQTSIVRIDGGTQVRETIDSAVVAEYAQAMKDGAEFPPLIVFRDETGALWLADGFHRLYAAREAGAAKIDCDIRSGTQRDAVLFAAGANAAHGVRRTNADKRRAVMLLLDDPEWSKWSNRKIADACGVSEAMVRTVRTPDTSNPRGGVRNAVDDFGHALPSGRRAPDEDRPPRSRPGLLDAPEIDQDEIGGADEDAIDFGGSRGGSGGGSARTPAAPLPAQVYDALDRPLPDRFRPVFVDGRQKYKDALDAIREAKHRVMALVNDGDGLNFFLSPKRITASLEQLKSEVETGRPHSMCPTCAGKGCKACDGKGWVNELGYKHAGDSTVKLFEQKQWGGAAKKGGTR